MESKLASRGRNLNVPKVFTRISELDTGETDKSLEPREMLALAVEHMTLGKHKDKRENWTLKNFFFHYNQTQTLQMQTFQWAARGEPPNEPDYLVCSRLDSQPLFVEVTELLDKERKRGDEYRSAWQEAEKTGDYLVATDMPAAPANYEQQLLEQARYVLKEKFSKPYPLGTWLIVYFNPTMFTPGWTASPKAETLSFATKILSKAARMLAKPQRITNIWVLTNDGRIGEILS